MKTDIADKWITALRSGDYKQGRNYLAVDGSFCCLGVICEVITDEANLNKYVHKDGSTEFNGASTVMPGEAVVYLGASDTNPSIHFTDMGFDFETRGLVEETGYGDYSISLAELNDAGFTFSQIADLIDYFKDEL